MKLGLIPLLATFLAVGAACRSLPDDGAQQAAAFASGESDAGSATAEWLTPVGVTSFVRDGNVLFYLDKDGTHRLPLDGTGGSTLVVPSDTSYDVQLGAAGGAVYVAGKTSDSSGRTLDSLRAGAPDGGAATLFENQSDDTWGLDTMRVGDDGVYFATNCGNVVRAPLDGGVPEQVTDHGCNVWPAVMPFALDPTHKEAYVASWEYDPDQWLQLRPIVLDVVVADGGTTTIVSKAPNPGAFAVDEDALYVLDNGQCPNNDSDYDPVCNGGSISRFDRNGENKRLLLDLDAVGSPDGLGVIQDLASDDEYLYFAAVPTPAADTYWHPFAIYRLAKTGGTPDLLYQSATSDTLGSSHVDVDDQFVYFEGDRIGRVAKAPVPSAVDGGVIPPVAVDASTATPSGPDASSAVTLPSAPASNVSTPQTDTTSPSSAATTAEPAESHEPSQASGCTAARGTPGVEWPLLVGLAALVRRRRRKR